MGKYVEDGILKVILRDAKTIAIVGLSDKPERPSYGVATYLEEAGYEIIPINPTIKRWKDKMSYASLASLPSEVMIDIVDIFRKSEEAPHAVSEAVSLSDLPKLIWLQEGVESEEAKKIAEEAATRKGKPVFFVQGKCLKKEHERLSRA